MNKTDDVMKLVSPGAVLTQIATSIPADCREHLIIIGSLAVGYPRREAGCVVATGASLTNLRLLASDGTSTDESSTSINSISADLGIGPRHEWEMRRVDIHDESSPD